MAEDARQDPTGQPSTERVSVPQAADHLGTTVDALRKRVQRGTIPHERDRDGRVWILLDTGRPRQDNDQDSAGQRQVRSAGGELVEELRDRVAYLERQVEEEREARRRADTIIAQLSSATAEQARTIRAIEAPQDTPGDAETVEEAPERTEPRPDGPGPQTATETPQAGAEAPRRQKAGDWRLIGSP